MKNHSVYGTRTTKYEIYFINLHHFLLLLTSQIRLSLGLPKIKILKNREGSDFPVGRKEIAMSTQFTQPKIIENDFYKAERSSSFTDAAATHAKTAGPTEMLKPAQTISQLGMQGDIRPSNPIQAAMYDLTQQLGVIEGTLSGVLGAVVAVICLVIVVKFFMAVLG